MQVVDKEKGNWYDSYLLPTFLSRKGTMLLSFGILTVGFSLGVMTVLAIFKPHQQEE